MALVTDMAEHKKALALTAEVQKSLLPQTEPVFRGLDIAGRNVSCGEIGGDDFDYLWRVDNPDGPLSVVVGDITGHGVDAAASANEILNAVYNALNQFTEGLRSEDDITLVVIKVLMRGSP
jgi:serine phosphatase RsbU (regulator of sigma subunit)